MIINFDMDGVLADFTKGKNQALKDNPEMGNLLVQMAKEIIDNPELERIKDALGVDNYLQIVSGKYDDKLRAFLRTKERGGYRDEFRPFYNKYYKKVNNFVFKAAEQKGFFANLPLMKGAKEMIDAALKIRKNRTSVQLRILSSPVNSDFSVPEKKEWVNKHFPNVFEDMIFPEDHNKGNYVTTEEDILIDDRIDYVKQFKNAGGRTIHHKNYRDTISELYTMTGVSIDTPKNPTEEKIINTGYVTLKVEPSSEIRRFQAKAKKEHNMGVVEKLHISLLQGKSTKKSHKKIKDFPIEPPKPRYVPKIYTAKRGDRHSAFLLIDNQEEFQEFRQKIIDHLEETTGESVDLTPYDQNRTYHLSIANAEGGNPHKSVADVGSEPEDLEEKIRRVINQLIIS